MKKVHYQHLVPHLDKTMPSGLQKTITVAQHADDFYRLGSTDVWTADGWLVVAVAGNNTTLTIRQANRMQVADFAPDALLHYTPTFEAIAKGM